MGYSKNVASAVSWIIVNCRRGLGSDVAGK